MKSYKYPSFILFILFALNTSIYAQNKIGRIQDTGSIMDCIDSIYIKHDSAKVRVATYFVNYRVKELYDKEFEDVSGYCMLEHNMFIFYQNSERWTVCNRMLTKRDVDLIARWCLMDKKINSIPLSKDKVSGVLFEEVVFEMQNGAKFFQPFIKNKNQYFGSLAPDQVCNLYYNILQYLTFSGCKSEEEFFSDYFQTFKEMSSGK